MTPAGRVMKDIALFEGVSSETLERHGLRATAVSLNAGESLVMAGEAQRDVWFLSGGWAQVRTYSPSGREATTSISGPGEMIGCENDLKLAAYPCSALALTPVYAIGVPAAAFDLWLRKDGPAAYRMVKVMAARLRESTALQTINAERASVRLQLTLSWLFGKFGAEIPATRALLADLTGLRAETCSRVLSALRRRGILRVSPRLITVLKPERLSAAAASRH